MSVGRVLSRAFAGALLVNAVPHGVNAARGRPFPSPFADPPGIGMSPPPVNAAWSLANAVAGVLVLGRRGIRSTGEGIALAAGAIVTGVVISLHFSSVMSGGSGLRRKRS